MYITVIQGGHNSGKTTNSLRHAVESALNKQRVLFVTTEQSVETIEAYAITLSQYNENLFDYLDIVRYDQTNPDKINTNLDDPDRSYDVIVVDNFDIYYKTLVEPSSIIPVREILRVLEVDCEVVISITDGENFHGKDVIITKYDYNPTTDKVTHQNQSLHYAVKTLRCP